MKSLVIVFAVALNLIIADSANAFDGYKRIPVDPSLKTVVKNCNQARAEFSEYVLCPSLEAYWLEDTSTFSLSRFFSEEIGMTPKESESSQATELLGTSMTGHLQFLLDEGTLQSQTVAQDYRKAILDLGTHIQRAEAEGLKIYIDPNAEWAPGIPAVAVVLIDNSRQTVTILMHGNGDS